MDDEQRERRRPPGDVAGEPATWAPPGAVPQGERPHGDELAPGAVPHGERAHGDEAPPPPPPFPPAAPSPSGTQPTMHVDADDAEGPPPPPHVRRRRRRRNTLLITAGLIVAGVPLVLGVVSNTTSPGSDDGSVAAGPDEGSEDEGSPADRREGGAEDLDIPDEALGDERLDRPEPADLDGVDALYAELLTYIDTSELTMMGFQDALAAAFAEAATADQEELARAIRDAAVLGQNGLATVREQLVDPVDDEGADAVRETYLRHLDSWATYMAAVEEDPGILAVEERTRDYTLSINVTADRFARTLEDELPEDVDDDVRGFADGILERGFRGFGEANV